MKHRVGITSELEKREDYWQGQYPSLKNWEIQAVGLTYEQAQAMENNFIKRGYEGSPGGQPVPGYVYMVYTFKY